MKPWLPPMRRELWMRQQWTGSRHESPWWRHARGKEPRGAEGARSCRLPFKKAISRPGGMSALQAENIRMGAAFGAPPTQVVHELLNDIDRLDGDVEMYQSAANRLAAAAERYREAAKEMQRARDTSKRRLKGSLVDWETIERRLLRR